MKKAIDTLDATPSKRLYQSIIADYDLNRSICELVDNALNVWARGGRSKAIAIEILLNKTQQTITVKDNAGGLRKSEMRHIVAPGETGTKETDETIGIFGVGTKRAVVALAQDIKITTRFPKEVTHRLDFDENWLEDDDDWQLNVYEVDPIPEGSTVVELQKLRTPITDETQTQLKDHLRSTYAKFITNKNVIIKLDGETLTPEFFENWAYPPGYPPTKYTGTLTVEDGNAISVEALAGLTLESSPATGEYGVYFYCNDRLITRAMKTFEVGFTRGLAGVAHPKVSLTRVLVSLHGEARLMPWNSSKSDIRTKHKVFVALHDWLVQVVKDYATLSRIWMGEWPEKVFKHTSGTIKEVKIDDFPTVTKSFLLAPPKTRPRYADVVIQRNRKIAKDKPWTKGLYEGIIAADLIAKGKLEQRNRIALIVLDSTLEIAFKEYLVNDSGTYYSDAQLLTLFAKRHLVQQEIQKYVNINGAIWKKIGHFNNLRNKLVHERATVGLDDQQIKDYRGVVETVLRKLFKLRLERG